MKTVKVAAQDFLYEKREKELPIHLFIKHILPTDTETNIIPETIPKTEDLGADYITRADVGGGLSFFISIIYVVIVYKDMSGI